MRHIRTRSKGAGISPWFKVQPLDFLHNGIRVFLTPQEGLIFQDQSWEFIEYERYDEPIPDGAVRTTIYRLGKIPFDNIVDFTKTSDEYGEVMNFLSLRQRR